jgi:hypothetical protein
LPADIIGRFLKKISITKDKKAGGSRRFQHQRSREVTETCWAKTADSAPFRTILRGTKRKQEKTSRSQAPYSQLQTPTVWAFHDLGK